MKPSTPKYWAVNTVWCYSEISQPQVFCVYFKYTVQGKANLKTKLNVIYAF